MNKKNLVLLHFLKDIASTNCFNWEHRFNGVFSRNSLPRIKTGAKVINLDDKKSKKAHCVSLFIGKKTARCFDSFGIEHTPQEV